jgi:hypothetical protein
MAFSKLQLVALHRPGSQNGNVSITDRWSWDFVIDGQSLNDRISDDVMGVLGGGNAAWEACVVDKLLLRGPPDIPPDRVALYICPECGDLDCGAVTASIAIDGEKITWRDFAWERGYDDVVSRDKFISLGPFHFEAASYARALQATLTTRPSPNTPSIAAG